jgi:hypothetical protein
MVRREERVGVRKARTRQQLLVRDLVVSTETECTLHNHVQEVLCQRFIAEVLTVGYRMRGVL